MPRDRGGPGRGRGLDRARQPGRRGDQRLRRARARQHRPAGRQAGDGRQGRPVQEVRRHRRLRHRDQGIRSRALRRGGGGARADLRRHQPGRRQGARVLRYRNEAARAYEHPGVPRRSARHGDHRRRRDHQRAADRRQGSRGGEAGHVRRRRRRARLLESTSRYGDAAREYLGDRHRRRRVHGPPARDGRLQGLLCPGHPGAHARRRHRRRGHLPRPVRAQRAEARHGGQDGRPADHHGAGQSRPGDPARGGARGAQRRDHRHRALGLSEPGQQRALLSVHLPRRARRRARRRSTRR